MDSTHQWQKSSYSSGMNSNCVECRAEDGRVFIRDTRHRHLGHLTLTAREWAGFLQLSELWDP